MKKKYKKVITSTILALCTLSSLYAGETIDASDPTKVYSYAGIGMKYIDYTNGDYMSEMRAIGNIGLSDKDMLQFEFGYGFHNGDQTPGNNSELTNSRLRWFHVFNMDYSISSGFRGWATQVDIQIAGSLKGTDGQNVLTLGLLPAFGINEQWSFFMPMNVVNSWDKKFENYNGVGINISPLFVYTPNWWTGSYVQIWPGYTYFVDGALKSEGAGNLDVTLGGNITDTVFWAVSYQANYDVDLRSFKRGASTGLTNNQNIFFNITTFY